MALHGWRGDPEVEMYELRDPGLLKLFCGADPEPLAGRFWSRVLKEASSGPRRKVRR